MLLKKLYFLRARHEVMWYVSARIHGLVSQKTVFFMYRPALTCCAVVYHEKKEIPLQIIVLSVCALSHFNF